MSPILPKLRDLVTIERRDVVTTESVESSNGNANGGSVIGGNQSGTESNTEINMGGNGGTINGDGTGNATVIGGNQSGGGNNIENNNNFGGSGGTIIGGDQSGGGNNIENNNNFGGNGGTINGDGTGNANGGAVATDGGTGGNLGGGGNNAGARNALIGGIVGGLIGLLILCALLVYYFKRRFRPSQKNPLDNITAFDASQYRNIEPRFPTDTKLLPDAPSITSPPSPSRGSSDSLASYPNSVNAPEVVNVSSPDNTLFLPGDLTEDQLTSRPSQPLQGLTRSFSILSDNPTLPPNYESE